MFKKYARNIVVTKSRNAIEIAVELYDQGYKNLTMVVGSDRVKVFDAMLKDYNGVEGKPHGYYKFDNINIVNAGERDPDSEGVGGMSASKMRTAAVDGDYNSFKMGVPSAFADSKKLYRDVRKYMGIREERDMGDMTDFETLRDRYLTGKIWNVGETVVVEGVEGEIVRKGTNYLSYMTEDGKVHKAWLHQIEERNYRKEYDNYQGQPEQIARRSSRNKARRVMGDKTKIGMDVGHRDNNPLNNDPKNLKNETPSKNRREPRLREIKKSTIGTSRGVSAAKDMIDEMSWYQELISKISQMKHPTGYERMAKAYAAKMREKEYKGKPGLAITDITKQTRNITPRQLAVYINKLVDKGVFPKELKTEYEPVKEEKLWSFKEFVNQIQETKPTKEDFTHHPTQVDPMKDKSDGWIKGDPTEPIEFDGSDTKSILDKANKEVEKERGVKVKGFTESYQLNEKVEELIKKSENSDIPYGTLKEIYDQSIIIYKENPKPGTTPHQWGLGAVDKFINEKSIDLNNSNERPEK